MSNERNSIDTLAESLRKSCRLFNQLVSENTRLRKLESHDRPTEPCKRRVDGEGQILTADEAVDHDEAKINEQAFVFHEVEQDFLAAIKDADRAIKQHHLVGTLEPSVSNPEEWLDELLAEIERMQVAALWPYYPNKDDSVSQPGAMTPEERMADFRAVLKRLHRLDCILARRSRLTPPKPEQTAGGDKPVLTIHIADMTATFKGAQYQFDQCQQWTALQKMARWPASPVKMTAVQATRLRQMLSSIKLPNLTKVIHRVGEDRYAMRTSDFKVVVIEPQQPPKN